jgi:hypothetical protein
MEVELAGIDLGLGFEVVVQRPHRNWEEWRGYREARAMEDRRRLRLEEGRSARWHLHHRPRVVAAGGSAGGEGGAWARRRKKD